MEQSIIEWRKKVSYDTPLRISQPNFIHQRNDYYTRNMPLSPYPRLDKQNKRPLSALEASTDQDKTKTIECPILLSERSNYGPSPKRLRGDNPLSSTQSLYLNISSAELLRASESILNHVDWSEVALEVAGNQRPSIYREAVMLILHAQVYELEIREMEKEEKEGEKQDEEDQDEEDQEDQDEEDEEDQDKEDEEDEKENKDEDEENDHETSIWC